MSDDSQRQDYDKKGSLAGAHAGPSGGTGGTGPTGSSRSYPKGKGGHTNTDWNPQKCKASTYGINGV
jgi:hypothetical protein